MQFWDDSPSCWPSKNGEVALIYPHSSYSIWHNNWPCAKLRCFLMWACRSQGKAASWHVLPYFMVNLRYSTCQKKKLFFSWIGDFTIDSKITLLKYTKVSNQGWPILVVIVWSFSPFMVTCLICLGGGVPDCWGWKKPPYPQLPQNVPIYFG